VSIRERCFPRETPRTCLYLSRGAAGIVDAAITPTIPLLLLPTYVFRLHALTAAAKDQFSSA
jgi:hypothetical protein